MNNRYVVQGIVLDLLAGKSVMLYTPGCRRDAMDTFAAVIARLDPEDVAKVVRRHGGEEIQMRDPRARLLVRASPQGLRGCSPDVLVYYCHGENGRLDAAVAEAASIRASGAEVVDLR